MDLNHRKYQQILPETEQDLPLDQVLKPRHHGKKLPSRNSSDQEPKNAPNVAKLKPISKEKGDPPKQVQANSNELVQQLIFDQSLKLAQLQDIMIRLKAIKNLKYQKLTEKVREALVETAFNYNYSRFVSIMYAYSPMTVSSHLIAAVFQGFVLAWKGQKFGSLDIFVDFFKLYEQIPQCINKPYTKWLSERAKEHPEIYEKFRLIVLNFVKQVIRKSNRQRSTENEKIIGLIVYFDLLEDVNKKELMKVVPLQKITEYIDNDKLPANDGLNPNNVLSPKYNKEKQSEKTIEVSQNQLFMEKKEGQSSMTSNLPPNSTIPPLIHSSILELLRQNNLKQTQKLIRAHKITYTEYPEFVQKLELKYLEYIERQYPIYFVDELIYNKINLVQNIVDMLLKRKKYDYVEHFVHKYMIRGVTEPNSQRILSNPLELHDCFGPTESHVLQKKTMDHFTKLSDFQITSEQVIWIDSKTIHYKPQADHLINLLYAKEVGIDSECASAIHVFEKSKLQVIQVYDPANNVVILFDVKNLKDDKKKRTRKSGNTKNQQKICQEKDEKNGKSIENKKETGKTINQPINLEQDEEVKIYQEKPQEKASYQIQESQKSEISHEKAWFKFTKIFENVLKRSTIYGHCLHADLGDIIEELNLTIKTKEIKFVDSQAEFKKYFPNETKSKLAYLNEKCFGKEISKYEQCSAWDKRPLRAAQIHYAALDAVLPYKLVKRMENDKK